jgi:hypothetical protein
MLPTKQKMVMSAQPAKAKFLCVGRSTETEQTLIEAES